MPMKRFRYIENVVSLTLDSAKCIGCGLCTVVCPQDVFTVSSQKKIAIADRDGCMECGACAKNCPTEAIHVAPGVGCAAYIIQTWLEKITKKPVKTNCC